MLYRNYAKPLCWAYLTNAYIYIIWIKLQLYCFLKKKSLVAYKKLKYATTTNNNMIENFAFLVLEVMRRLGGWERRRCGRHKNKWYKCVPNILRVWLPEWLNFNGTECIYTARKSNDKLYLIPGSCKYAVSVIDCH